MAMKTKMPIIVAEWPRSKRELVRITLDQYCGRNVIALRTWWTNQAGTKCPGRDGITLDVSHVVKLAKAFKKAARGSEKGRADRQGLPSLDLAPNCAIGPCHAPAPIWQELARSIARWIFICSINLQEIRQ